MRIPPGATFFHDRKVANFSYCAMPQCGFFPQNRVISSKQEQMFWDFFWVIFKHCEVSGRWYARKCTALYMDFYNKTIEKPRSEKKVFCYFCYCYVAMRLLGKCDELLGSIIHSMNHHHAHHLKKVSGLLLFIFLFLFSVAGKKKRKKSLLHIQSSPLLLTLC